MSGKVVFEKIDINTIKILKGSQVIGMVRCGVCRPGNITVLNHGQESMDVVSVENIEGNIELKFANQEKDVCLRVELIKDSVGFTGKMIVQGSGHVIVSLSMEIPKSEDDFAFLPAFMYGKNEGGDHPMAMYPQLGDGTDKGYPQPWVSPEWRVRADRSSHGFTSVINNDYAVAIGGRDVSRHSDGSIAEKNGLGIAAKESNEILFSMGFANVPYTYSCASLIGRNFISRPEGYVNLDNGAVESEIFMLIVDGNVRQKMAGRLLRESYRITHEHVRDSGKSVNEAIDDIADALVKYGYCEDVKNFYTTFTNEKPSDSMMRIFSSGWAGGMQVAYPLLAAAHKRGRADWLEAARIVIGNFAGNAISPKSGMFFDNYNAIEKQWNVNGWWSQGEGHSGYVNGQACHFMLIGYLLEKNNGKEQDKWLEAAKQVLDKVAETQGEDGRFGYYYSAENGSIVDGVGFAGCWFTPGFATLYKITGDEKYLDIARKAMCFYRYDVERFEVFGCPHDAFKSPDEEGILGWIAAARLLHGVTGESQFLDDLMAGLDYEFSWKFSYNVVNEVEPLKSLNWCSTGGSVTSTNNSHIHPMGSAILGSILYVYKQTGDEYIKSRLIDTLRWTVSSYLHEDGQYGWGKKGMINERFCYTDSLLLERFSDGSPASNWFCGHSWASGSVLEGLAVESIDDFLNL